MVLTVGGGDADRVEETLLAPMRASIERGRWDLVVLVPSKPTEPNAERLREKFPKSEMRVEPLARPGDEDDADACFAHVDDLFERLEREGFCPSAVHLDFTRGTKAMSAAAVLAATKHGVTALRYVTGRERDSRGFVRPGTEIVREFQALEIALRWQLASACHLLWAGSFAATLEILPGIGRLTVLPADVERRVVAVRQSAEFFARWDRLDYVAAAAAPLPSVQDLPAEVHPLYPKSDIVRHVQFLAEPMPSPVEPERRQERLSALVLDLLANAERRASQGHFEDALLRGYRIQELMAEWALLGHGLNSSNLPRDHPKVAGLLRKNVLRPGRGGRIVCMREGGAALLCSLGDPFGDVLNRLGNRGQLTAAHRNESLLVHGHSSVGFEDDGRLKRLLSDLADAFLELDGNAARHLHRSRWLSFADRRSASSGS